MNQMPKTLKVGAITYTVQEFDPDIDLEGIEIDSETILSDAMDAPRTKAQMMLASIVSLICQHAALPKKLKRRQAVHAISAGLAAVWRDNPEMVAWIESALVYGDPKPDEPIYIGKRVDFH